MLFHAQRLLGGALLEQARWDDAQPLLVEGFEGLNQLSERIPTACKSHQKDALQRLIDLYDAWDKLDEAAKWRIEMVELKRELGIVERPEAGVRPPGPRLEAGSR